MATRSFLVAVKLGPLGRGVAHFTASPASPTRQTTLSTPSGEGPRFTAWPHASSPPEIGTRRAQRRDASLKPCEAVKFTDPPSVKQILHRNHASMKRPGEAKRSSRETLAKAQTWNTTEGAAVGQPDVTGS
jgi:hypothetical protein